MRLVVVTGSRSWDRSDVIRDSFRRCGGSMHLVHGDARGADRLAARIAATELHWSVEAMPADWSRGKKAGRERNLAMLDRQPDVVVAFCREGSRGTLHTVINAVNRGIPVVLYWQDKTGHIERFGPIDCHRRYFGRSDPFRYRR